MPYKNVWMTVEALTDPNLTGADIRVLSFMVANTGKSQVFELSRETIVAHLECLSPRTVTRSWETLEKYGYIERVTNGQKFGGGPGWTAQFRVTEKASPR